MCAARTPTVPQCPLARRSRLVHILAQGGLRAAAAEAAAKPEMVKGENHANTLSRSAQRAPKQCSGG